MDATCATARFDYGPAHCAPPSLASNDPISVIDDNGKTWLFPNVNGDTNVVCREIATERDLLYVGGVWYEVPADNAGGFAALRPIALADEPVKSLYGERGLMYLNGKAMVIDDLWKNGTAAVAYWLWEKNSKDGGDCPQMRYEIDHLDGILYIDHMSAVERLACTPKLKKLVKANGGVR